MPSIKVKSVRGLDGYYHKIPAEGGPHSHCASCKCTPQYHSYLEAYVHRVLPDETHDRIPDCPPQPKRTIVKGEYFELNSIPEDTFIHEARRFCQCKPHYDAGVYVHNVTPKPFTPDNIKLRPSLFDPLTLEQLKDCPMNRGNELLKDNELGFGETMEPTANDIQEGGDHYLNMDIEPWDVVDTWPLEQRIGFYRGNLLKYTMRLGTKDEREGEAKKARHYAHKLAEVLEEASAELLKQPGVTGV